jgi:hypothetical protein
MVRNEIRRLTLRLLTLFVLIACLFVLSGGRAASARTCNQADVNACILSHGRWYNMCCTCADQWTISECEWDGMHWWNACTQECVLIQ